jgi:hypothetical protein
MNKPEALIITYPAALLKKHGGYRAFRTGMLEMNRHPDACWLQRCRNRPRHSVLYVYVVVGGRLKFRLNLVEWDNGTPVEAMRPDGTMMLTTWPRLVLSGPVIEAPERIPMRGFQGFRYTNELYF